MPLSKIIFFAKIRARKFFFRKKTPKPLPPEYQMDHALPHEGKINKLSWQNGTSVVYVSLKIQKKKLLLRWIHHLRTIINIPISLLYNRYWTLISYPLPIHIDFYNGPFLNQIRINSHDHVHISCIESPQWSFAKQFVVKSELKRYLNKLNKELENINRLKTKELVYNPTKLQFKSFIYLNFTNWPLCILYC